MFVENLLLPRFLIIELVIGCHYFQFTKACGPLHKFSEVVAGTLKGDSSANLTCLFRPENIDWANQPLLFTPTRDWLYAEPNGNIHIDEGLLLYCPGTHINCSNTAEPYIALSCTGNHQLYDNDGRPVDLNHCGCKKNPKDRERDVDSSCGPDGAGQLAEIGFEIDTSFKPVLTVCHDKKTESTFYSRHQIRGATLVNKEVVEDNPAFKKGKLFFKGLSARQAYTKVNQKRVFGQFLGPEEVKRIFAKNYMARGHLSPEADFIFKDWQESTYYYGNTAPQWQSINNGNWKRLEFAVRELAGRSASLYEIYTGTLGHMSVEGNEVWLASKRNKPYIPVPEYFFKIITDVENKRSMAVFCTNNPLLSRVTRSKILCNDICDETGWGQNFDQRREADDGVLFCCSPAEFSEILPWAGPRGLHTHANLLF